jgi:hypothetical protein
MKGGKDMVIAIVAAVALVITAAGALAMLGVYAIGKAINHIQRGDL